MSWREALAESRVERIPYVLIQVRAIVARAYVRIVGVNRDVASVAIEVLLPLFAMGAYAMLYRTMAAPPEYTGFVILGSVMTSYWLNVLWGMASQLYWEKRSGNLPLYMIAPMSRLSILAGMAVGSLFSTTLRALMTALVGGLLLGVRVQPSLLLPASLVFVLTLLALYGLGMMTSSIFLLWGREAWHLSNLLQEPVYLLSGFFFPVRALGPVVSGLAGLIPITLGLDALRQILFPLRAQGLLPVRVSLGLLVIQMVLYLVVARRFLTWMETLSRREGTLTLRYQ